MSLYYETAALLTNSDRVGGSLKSRIYGKKDLKSSASQIFALAAEAAKWSPLLKDVIERAGVLGEERKLTPTLALLLTHDLLLSKHGVAAPANHPLKLAITRHKARLQAELSRARLRLGLGDLEALKAHVHKLHVGQTNGGSDAEHHRHPRWARVNTLKATSTRLAEALKEQYDESNDLTAMLSAPAADKTYCVDKTIADLLAFPPGHDVSLLEAYKTGLLIVQDKASCFPAALLDPSCVDGDILDATAAPGNKTTHLAALLRAAGPNPIGSPRKVIAYERNAVRFKTLQKMVQTAGADMLTDVRHQDFLTVDPTSKEVRNVTAILLDPSCSGSGIVGRDDDLKLVLPETTMAAPPSSASKKRKRSAKVQVTGSAAELSSEDPESEQTPLDALEKDDEDALEARLEALSTFQLKILLHAMSFPSCRRITYSTCSTHYTENENVVLRALRQSEADSTGWRILRREDQPSGLSAWPLRGDANKCDDKTVAQACIRCEKGTEDGTMGFFVAGFVRDLPASTASNARSMHTQDGEDEWEGFDD